MNTALNSKSKSNSSRSRDRDRSRTSKSISTARNGIVNGNSNGNGNGNGNGISHNNCTNIKRRGMYPHHPHPNIGEIEIKEKPMIGIGGVGNSVVSTGKGAGKGVGIGIGAKRAPIKGRGGMRRTGTVGRAGGGGGGGKGAQHTKVKSTETAKIDKGVKRTKGTQQPATLKHHRNSNILHRFRFSPRKQQHQQQQQLQQKPPPTSSTAHVKAGGNDGKRTSTASASTSMNVNTSPRKGGDANVGANGSSSAGDRSSAGGFKRFIQKASGQYKALDEEEVMTDERCSDIGSSHGNGHGHGHERIALKDINGVQRNNSYVSTPEKVRNEKKNGSKSTSGSGTFSANTGIDNGVNGRRTSTSTSPSNTEGRDDMNTNVTMTVETLNIGATASMDSSITCVNSNSLKKRKSPLANSAGSNSNLDLDFNSATISKSNSTSQSPSQNDPFSKWGISPSTSSSQSSSSRSSVHTPTPASLSTTSRSRSLPLELSDMNIRKGKGTSTAINPSKYENQYGQYSSTSTSRKKGSLSPTQSPLLSSSAKKRHRESTSPNSKALLQTMKMNLGNISASSDGNDGNDGNDFYGGNVNGIGNVNAEKDDSYDDPDHEMPPVSILELELNHRPEDDVDVSNGGGRLSDSPTSMTPDAFNGLYYADDEDLTDDDNSEGGVEDMDDDDDDDDDDESCASTVVNDLPPRVVRPPPTATKEQQAKFYWELCYGSTSKPPQMSHSQGSSATSKIATTATSNMHQTPRAGISMGGKGIGPGQGLETGSSGKFMQGSWSASRKEPTKSCLSVKKTKWTEIAESASKRIGTRAYLINRPPPRPATANTTDTRTPQTDHPWKIGTTPTQGHSNAVGDPSPIERRSLSFTSTPQSRDDGIENNQPPGSANSNDSGTSNSSSGSDDKKQVKFGVLSAAEFESSRPVVNLTPLTEDQVKARFCLEKKEEDSDEGSTELHQETARNGDVLAMWEDDFDTYVDGWDDMNNSLMAVAGGSDEDDFDSDSDMETKMGSRGKSRSRSSFGGGRRDVRRSSTFFSRDGGPLIDPIHDNGADSSKKMHDLEPSEAYDESSNPALSRPFTQHEVEHQSRFRSSIASRDSLQYSSPSTNGSFRLSASGSENSQVTPMNDVASSSSLLRSVHSAGGASNSLHFTPTNDPESSTSILHSVHSAGGASNIPNQAQHRLKPNQLDHALQQAEGNTSDFSRIPSTNQDNLDSPTAFHAKLLSKTGNEETLTDMLQFCKTDILKAHRLETSLASSEEIQRYHNGSFLDIVREVDKAKHCTRSSERTYNTGRRDAAEVIQMSVSLLEQNVEENTNDDSEIRTRLENAHLAIESEDLEDLTYHCAHVAVMEWLQKEADALETALTWLPSLDGSNREEEATILNRLKLVEAIRIKSCPHSSAHKKNSRQRMKERLRAINRNLESAIQIEQKKLEKTNLAGLLLQSKCEVERHRPRNVVAFHLLKHLLPYECKQVDPLIFSYHHMDSPSSQTQVTWNPSQQSPEHVKRDSIGTYDSFKSWSGFIIQTPEVKMLERNDQPEKYRDHMNGYLSKDSLARKLYCLLLESDHMRNFVTSQFKYEYEMGIMTIADVFQRLNLLALDIMEVEKSYTCRLIPSSRDCVFLQVVINLDQQSSIGMRFTYNLLKSQTFLMSMPSEVFVEPITGEPTVPINTLIQIAKQSIALTEAKTNAFILKRTCKLIVDTLQGRSAMEI